MCLSAPGCPAWIFVKVNLFVKSVLHNSWMQNGGETFVAAQVVPKNTARLRLARFLSAWPQTYTLNCCAPDVTPDVRKNISKVTFWTLRASIKCT